MYPDIGLKGPLVREKLHGRTASGTWIQLEKTPASMGKGFHMPGINDLKHLADYIVYRITKSNVGPWGLSGMTEKRPMYLSPDLGVTMPLPAAAEAELTGALELLEDDDDTTAASADLAVALPAARPRGHARRARLRPRGRAGSGLFGASDVWVTETPSRPARELLDARRRGAALDAAAGPRTVGAHPEGGRPRDPMCGAAGPPRRGGRDMTGGPTAGDADIPKGLIDSVVHLVGTGPCRSARTRSPRSTPSTA